MTIEGGTGTYTAISEIALAHTTTDAREEDTAVDPDTVRPPLTASETCTSTNWTIGDDCVAGSVVAPTVCRHRSDPSDGLSADQRAEVPGTSKNPAAHAGDPPGSARQRELGHRDVLPRSSVIHADGQNDGV
jgi:hypothetical protein